MFDAQDQTSATNYYRFWVNNDYDGYDPGIGDQADLNPAGGSDANKLSISCTRDLEDYTRLWINTQGITSELQNGTFLLALEWKDTTDDPQMQLFQAAETNGGSLYLTDADAAGQQVNNYGFHISRMGAPQCADQIQSFHLPDELLGECQCDDQPAGGTSVI